jgi:hypothetical protein
MGGRGDRAGNVRTNRSSAPAAIALAIRVRAMADVCAWQRVDDRRIGTKAELDHWRNTMKLFTDRRRRLIAGLTALATSTGLMVAVHDTPAAAYDPDRGLRCADDLCLISVGGEWIDSDGDGTSDADERAAGTDPHDPDSKPPVPFLVHLASIRQLPSFESGMTHIVALPTVAPDGKSLTSSLPSVGRTDAMTRLGLTSELLGKVNLANTGIRIGVDPSALLGTKFGGPGPLLVGGVNVGLISAGDDEELAPIVPVDNGKALHNYGPNSGKVAKGADKREGATTVREYTDGSKDVQQLSEDGKTITQQSYDKDGNLTGNGMTTIETKQGSDGENISTVSTWTNTYNGDGSVTTHVDVVTTSAKDNDVTTYRIHSTSTVKADGSRDTEMVRIFPDGDGNKTISRTICANGSCKNFKQYVNPDAESSVLYLSDADIERVLGKSGWNSTPGPAQPVVIEEAPDVTFGGIDPTIAYIEDDPSTPHDGDGVVFVETKGPWTNTTFDPRLPNLTSQLPPLNHCVPSC